MAGGLALSSQEILWVAKMFMKSQQKNRHRQSRQKRKKKNQLHTTANVQGQCLHRSSVNWLEVKSECWLLAAKPILQNPIALVHFRIVSATHSYISGKFGRDFGFAVSF